MGGRRVIARTVAFVLLLGGLYFAARYDFLLFHTLAELFSIVIAAGVFIVAWNARSFHASKYVTFLGLAWLFIAALDLVHTLAFRGMNIFRGYDVNLPTQLWVAARGMEAVTLLVAPFTLRRRFRPGWVIGSYAAASALLLVLIFGGLFPDAWVDGRGLTTFKIVAEYVICAILLAALGLLWAHRAAFDRRVLHFVSASLVVTVASEFAFTLYDDPYNLYNWTGHVLKVLSFYLIYKAIIQTSLVRPYGLLFRDLEERRRELEQAKGQAEEASRAKDRFLAVLSHELRNPLNPVLIAVSALQRDGRLHPGLQADVEMIRRNAELEARLIDDLLDLSRIVTGKLQIVEEVVDAHAMLRNAMEIALAGGKRLDVRVSLDAADHHVRGDGARLQQVFWNLLKNAVKFTPEDGRIAVRTSNAADGVFLLEVADSGVGIEPAVLPCIFNAFEQGGPGVTRQFGGLGLGLAITRALVERHGGTIRAESAGTGRGATFTIRLPAVPAPAPATQPPASTLVGPAPSRRRILLVEDHADTLRLMSRLLRASGHEVQEAASLAEATAAAAAGRFDLVISDLGLPDGSGLDLMRSLRGAHNLRGISLSGYGMEQDRIDSRSAGFEVHLTKPVDLGALEAAIERLS